jgi:hypothetical protein
MIFLCSPSPLQGWVNQLARAALGLDLIPNPENHLAVIPLQLLPPLDRRIYGTPLALSGAVRTKQTPAQVAQQLVQALPPEWADVEVTETGWIYFSLRDAAIADWLTQITQEPPQLQPNPVSLETRVHPPAVPPELMATIPAELLFAAQHVHARCCSLLRLADREQRIQLTDPNPDLSPPLWRRINPPAFSWLTATGKLRLQHPPERLLINHLLNFFATANPGHDHYSYLPQIHLPQTLEPSAQITPIFYPPTPQILKRQLSAWRDRFEQFHRHCPIWGEIEHQDQPLAQARLGLLIATQGMLYFYLQTLLGTLAPLEL